MKQQKLRKYDFKCCPKLQSTSFCCGSLNSQYVGNLRHFFFSGGDRHLEHEFPVMWRHGESPGNSGLVSPLDVITVASRVLAVAFGKYQFPLGMWTKNLPRCWCQSPSRIPVAFLEISAPGISYQNLYLRLLFNGGGVDPKHTIILVKPKKHHLNSTESTW